MERYWLLRMHQKDRLMYRQHYAPTDMAMRMPSFKLGFATTVRFNHAG
jgi:hypothetical protein